MKPQDRTRAVLRSGLKSGEKLVLVAVCDYCNTHGESFPSVTTLAADCALNRATVIKHLAALEGRGLVKSARPGRSTLYRFSPEDLPTRRKSRPVANHDQSQITTPTRRKTRPHPSQNATPPVAKRDPKRIPKRPSEATNEAGDPSTPTGWAEGPSKSAKGIWVEEAQARGWMVVVPSRADVQKLAPVWKGAGPERFRAVVGQYMDAVQAGEHWQRESTPQVGPFIKGAQEALSAVAGDAPGTSRLVELVSDPAGLCRLGQGWGAVSKRLEERGDDAEKVGQVYAQALGLDCPWKAWGVVMKADEWETRKMTKKAVAAARRMG